MKEKKLFVRLCANRWQEVSIGEYRCEQKYLQIYKKVLTKNLIQYKNEVSGVMNRLQRTATI